jgi:glycerol-3-phosphate dehydrogenase
MPSFPGRGPLPERVDIIILGGGVNGVAIARTCAQARKSVLLVERDDFACGISSRSSRTVYGGLHALRQGSFRKLREALHGRAALLRDQPHLVQPLDFVLATPAISSYPGLPLRAALWLYRKLGSLPPAASVADLESLRRSLDPAQGWTLSAYQEAQCEFPERLVADWLRDACTAGAIARNHATALAIRAADGRVRGVLLRDGLTNEECYVESEWVINATGPWVDLVRDLTGLTACTPLARSVRSSHLMLHPWPGAPTIGLHAAAIPSPLPFDLQTSRLQSSPSQASPLQTSPLQVTQHKGRSISLAPWNGMLQVGSTQAVHAGDPSLASPSAEEVDFLLTSTAALFPEARLTAAAIAFSYAGVQPIAQPIAQHIGQPTAYDPSESFSVSGVDACRHVLHNHADEGALGLLSVFGGTLATASALAHKTAHTMELRLERLPDSQLVFGECFGVENSFQQWASAVHATTGIPKPSTEAIARWHGRHAMCVIQSALHDAILRAPIVDDRPQLVAQAVEAVAYEGAVTLADILLRRVPIALDQNWNEDSTRQAAARIAPALYWNERRIRDEVQAFEEERSRFLHKPKNLKPTIIAA